MNSGIKKVIPLAAGAAIATGGILGGYAAASSTTTATPVAHHHTVSKPRATPSGGHSQAPAQQQQAPASPTPSQPAQPQQQGHPNVGQGYLGDVNGGGTQNPCNYSSGVNAGVCNPTGQNQQQYNQNPGGPAPGTPTNSQGCYYVKMGEGFCPSTGQYVPMSPPGGG